MLINDDFTKRAIVRAAELDWTPSPMAGVERRMLDRIGDEVARATTIVRYAPGSEFSPHVHDGGEEFLVLDGVFQDEHGDFPAGSYVRNPPTSRHTPRSGPGCTILVKLHQFDPDDRTEVKLRADQITPEPDPTRPGVATAPLFEDDRETVRVETLAPGTRFEAGHREGYEALLLQGDLAGEDGTFGQLTWLRLPPGDALELEAGSEGARLWVKTRHLAPGAAQAGPPAA